MSKIYNISLMAFSLFAFGGYAQVKDKDKLETISVDIVKPYTPTIADVHKDREETPKKDSVTVAKKKVTYTTHSVPVASTFVPEKGKAVRMSVSSVRDTLYQSYAALGLGNYATLFADAFVAVPISDTDDFLVDFNHHSSRGDVKGITLDNNFANTQLQAGYHSLQKEYQWGLSANVQHRMLHWYGVEDVSLLPISGSLKQSYLDGGLSGMLTLSKGAFEGLDFFVQGMKDDFKSSELHLNLRPSMRFALKEGQTIRLKAEADFLQGSFDRGFASTDGVSYKSALLGLRPSYTYATKEFSLRVGLGGYYAKENDNSGDKFRIFPDLEFSYDPQGKGVVWYGGITGDLKQVTYREQSVENPYISPTQELHPTYTPYDIFAGVRGRAFKGFSYDVKAFYTRIEQMPLFRANEKYTLTTRLPYHYDNTYRILYQDAMSFGAKASLLGKLSEKFSMDWTLKIATYSFDETDQEAWNLPLFTSSFSVLYQVLPQWNIGASFFYVGERKDIKHPLAAQPVEEVTMNGFFDLNFSTDYTFLKRWTAFASLHNVTGDNYLRWSTYPVQGFQFLIGMKYRFNVK